MLAGIQSGHPHLMVERHAHADRDEVHVGMLDHFVRVGNSTARPANCQLHPFARFGASRRFDAKGSRATVESSIPAGARPAKLRGPSALGLDPFVPAPDVEPAPAAAPAVPFPLPGRVRPPFRAAGRSRPRLSARKVAGGLPLPMCELYAETAASPSVGRPAARYASTSDELHPVRGGLLLHHPVSLAGRSCQARALASSSRLARNWGGYFRRNHWVPMPPPAIPGSLHHRACYADSRR